MLTTSLEDKTLCQQQIKEIQALFVLVHPSLECNINIDAQDLLKEEILKVPVDLAIKRYHYALKLIYSDEIAHPFSLLRELSPILFDLNRFLSRVAEAGHHEVELEMQYKALLELYQRYGFSEKTMLLQTPMHSDHHIDNIPLYCYQLPEYYTPFKVYEGKTITQVLPDDHSPHHLMHEQTVLEPTLYSIFIHAVKTNRIVPAEGHLTETRVQHARHRKFKVLPLDLGSRL